MKVFIERENSTKTISLDKEINCRELLKDLKISRESVILVKNGNVCLEDEVLEDSDELKILSVVSGG